MSGIYIPGVTVPEDNTILLRIFPESDGKYYTEQLDIDEDILDKYFAIPVPEHGRLIDADALAKTLGISDMDCYKCAWGNHGFCGRGGDFNDACEAIEDAPTIIPASGGKENE